MKSKWSVIFTKNRLISTTIVKKLLQRVAFSIINQVFIEKSGKENIVLR